MLDTAYRMQNQGWWSFLKCNFSKALEENRFNNYATRSLPGADEARPFVALMPFH